MQQGVEVQGCGSSSGCRPGSQEGRVESMRDRVEGEGARVDGRRRNDVDGMAGQKRGGVPWNNRVGQVGQGNGRQVWLGDVVDLSEGLRVRVGVDADGGGGGGSVVLQDGVLHRRDGRG